MRKLVKGLSLALCASLTAGVLAGCAGTKKNVAFEYDSSEYIKIGNYKGVEVTVDDFSVTEESLNNVISQLQDKYIQYNVVDRAAKDGDLVLASFTAYISGSKVEGFSGNDQEVKIGSGNFIIPGFEEQLIGMKSGDSRAITGLKVPDDFSIEEKYAGKSITFDATIDTVYEPYRMEYNDEFVTAMTKGEYTSAEEYKKVLIGMLEDNAVTNAENDKYHKVMASIIENTEIIKEFPAEYVDSKLENINAELEKYLPLYSMEEKDYLVKYYGKENKEEIAKEQILLELILQEVVKQENLSVTEKYYKDNLESTAMARNYSTAEKFVESLGEDGVVKCMLADKATKLIMDGAIVK